MRTIGLFYLAAIVTALLAASVVLVPTPGKAQHICGSGPGPGEVQVGETGGGQGVASAPLCNWVQQQQQAPGPSAPPPPPPSYGAFATDSDHNQIYWVAFYATPEQAEAAAIASCQKRTGKTCNWINNFGENCSAIAVSDDKIWVGYSRNLLQSEQNAMDDCNKAAEADDQWHGICHLWQRGVCAGQSYNNASNIPALTATPDDVEQLSARLDHRQYWGVLASDGSQIQGAYGWPTRSHAETLAMAKCQGCKVVLVFKDTCAGQAWPHDNRPVFETALDIDPAAARAKALGQCTAKYGACDTAVRCSGRRYPNPTPDAAGAPK